MFLLAIWRLYCTLTFTKMLVHPDELYQGTQIAYDFIFGGVDLPWEWRDPYRIRNALYPIYLSWPLAVLKFFKIDYQYLVLLSPYIAHFPLMILSDIALWHVGKQTVGKDATRVAFVLILTNLFMFEFEIRCFTNTLEKILTVIAYYFYLKQGNKFTLNTAAFTALLTLGFVMRNTSPVGWIPLLFIKVFKDGAFLPFLLAAIVIALPLIIGCVYLDSIYYMGANTSSSGTSLDERDANKKFEWTITSYNFLKVNVLQGLSKYFGDHQFLEYVLNFLPKDIFKGLFPLMVGGLWCYCKDMSAKKLTPDMVYMCLFYIVFFSLLGHKENRFLLPILPFLFLLTGYGVVHFSKIYPKFTKILLWITILVESSMFMLRQSFHHRFWDALEYITNYGDTPPHSLYSMHRFETPYYSWLHQHGQADTNNVNRTKLYNVQQGPSFARKAFGAPLQISNPDYTSYYIESIGRLIDGEMRPEWVLIPERSWDCADRYYCS